MKCKICSNEFALSKKDTYIVFKNMGLFGADKYYDAVNCPQCGCQNVLGERLCEFGLKKVSESSTNKDGEK
ncbi:MAG: hypothetical protein FWE33_04615 [Defluviitaleaceae bacterium]|nr:hypothetical protein [Defluviitaleaceae bacterium]